MKSRIHLVLAAAVLSLAFEPGALASTIWYVNGINGSDSDSCTAPTIACKTIGHAISQALSGDSIIVAAATYTENLNVGFSLNLIGSGANTTIIDGGGSACVVGISNNSIVSISFVTIRNGHCGFGGGIYNNARLTINASTITGNIAFISRNLCCGYGGGIYNATNATLTINNSTISANTAGTRCGLFPCPGDGGGIENLGRLFINNSTLSGNYAYGVSVNGWLYGRGGGIDNEGGTLSISNSTVSGNSGAHGGGIYGLGFFQNTIVANNSVQNCYNHGGSNGYNLSSDGSCNFNNTGDMNNTNPELGPLQNNGGPTDTMALLPGSPAIDAGNPNGCTDNLGNLLKTDQRGMPRPDREDTRGCDMGAYESPSD